MCLRVDSDLIKNMVLYGLPQLSVSLLKSCINQFILSYLITIEARCLYKRSNRGKDEYYVVHDLKWHMECEKEKESELCIRKGSTLNISNLFSEEFDIMGSFQVF